LHDAPSERESFTRFVEARARMLQRALIAAFGPEVGTEATSDALAYGWQHWNRVGAMENPSGYLYRVGFNLARRMKRPQRLFPEPPAGNPTPLVEPGLPAALEGLTDQQRTATVLVHAGEWTYTEVGNVMGVDAGTAKKHAERGLAKLRKALEVDHA
jgi:RNA polymerase sigma-70 factor (ECF subfamily)